MLLYMRKTDYILNIPSAARMNGNTYKLEIRGKKMRVESGVLWAEKFFSSWARPYIHLHLVFKKANSIID